MSEKKHIGQDDARMWELLSEFMHVTRTTGASGEPISEASYSFDGLDRVWEMSKTDASAFNALRMLAGLALAEGKPMPLPLQYWAGRFLMGYETPPPAPTRQRSITRTQRDRQIAIDVFDLHYDEGMVATRNEASTATSACDVVAERWGLQYRTVEEIWKKHKKLFFRE